MPPETTTSTLRKPPRRWTPRNWASRKPFGIGEQRPNNYLEVLRAAWESRTRPRYAWRILTRGVCDGCALGTAGLHDWTLDGVHLCNVRLRLLRLNTMPALDADELADVGPLRDRSAAELRRMGRLPHPMLRRRGEQGFSRVSWDRALEMVAERIRTAGADRAGFYLTSRGTANETYYAAQKATRAIGTSSIDNAARVCHSPSTFGLKEALGVAATTCSYTDLIGTDLVVLRLQRGQQPAGDDQVPALREEGRHPDRGGEPVPRAGAGALLGPVGGGERAIRDPARRSLLSDQRRRRHRLPLRDTQAPGRAPLDL